jgi:hypothetical protein
MRLTTKRTPFTALPRAIHFFARTAFRQRLGTFLVFSFVPTILFWAWFLLEVRGYIPKQYKQLHFAAPIASLWVTFGPLLLQPGVCNLARLVAAFNYDGEKSGWNMPAIQAKITQADNLYYWITFPLGVAAALALSASVSSLKQVIPVEDPLDRSAGLFTVFVVGFVSASGIWGVGKALAVVSAATKSEGVLWWPFRSTQIWSIRQLYSFIWSVAVIFSAGSVFVPPLLVVRQQLTMIAAAIVTIFIGLLLTGGLILFSVPAVLLYRLLQRQKDHVLDQLAHIVEHDAAKIPAMNRMSAFSVVRLHYSLEAALRLRSAMKAESTSPVSFDVLGRAATTLVLPMVLTAIQIIASSD